ncbi:MAG: vWA domain-containing protein, partial [Gemmatimonadota bacterium]
AERERGRLADEGLLAQFVRLPGPGARWVRLGLLAAGAGALVLATAYGSLDTRRADPEGAETVLVLDASNSMLVEDVEPSRLERERALAAELAGRIPGRVGVVYFAGRAYVLSPLTTDRNAVRMFVEGVRPAAVGRGGSSPAAGLIQAIDLLARGDERARKAIVLFSDGEATVEQPVEDALERARDAGVRVHVVGLGTAEGGPIPLTRDASLDPATALRRSGGPSLLEGPDGTVVVSRLEEGTLRRISRATNGRYVEGDADGLRRVASELGEADAALPASGSPVASALLLLAFVSLWGEAFLIPRG